MKALLLGAVAIVASASGAFAGQHVITLDPFCDTFTVTTQDGTSKILSMVSQNTGCDDGLGIGGSAKVSGVNYATIGVVYSAIGASEIWSLQLQEKLHTGNAWILSSSTDGVNFTTVNSGTYTVDSPAVHHSGKPATQR